MGCASSTPPPTSAAPKTAKTTTTTTTTTRHNMPSSAQEWIEQLKLQPHPEGGYYVETYRSECRVQSSKGDRSASTAIYFLVTPGNVSRLHRLTLADEVWHFYAGQPLNVVELVKDGPHKTTRLGLSEGCVPQYTVTANTWFGSFPNDKKDNNTPASDDHYSLVGCTVAPGFEFSDFELGSRAQLLQDFPKADPSMIEKLTQGLP